MVDLSLMCLNTMCVKVCIHACVGVMVGTHHSSALLFDCTVTTATLLLVNSGGLEGCGGRGLVVFLPLHTAVIKPQLELASITDHYYSLQ